MDHALRSFDFDDDDQRVVNPRAVALDGGQHRVALDRDGGLEGDDISGSHVARDYVVEQDVGQRGIVLEQNLHSALGQVGEGVVRRGEDGERAFAGQRLDESGGSQGSDQGPEAFIARGDCE